VVEESTDDCRYLLSEPAKMGWFAVHKEGAVGGSDNRQTLYYLSLPQA
jgi:hypothetical protein